MRKAGTEQVVLLKELYRNSLNLVECASYIARHKVDEREYERRRVHLTL